MLAALSGERARGARTDRRRRRVARSDRRAARPVARGRRSQSRSLRRRPRSPSEERLAVHYTGRSLDLAGRRSNARSRCATAGDARPNASSGRVSDCDGRRHLADRTALAQCSLLPVPSSRPPRLAAQSFRAAWRSAGVPDRPTARTPGAGCLPRRLSHTGGRRLATRLARLAHRAAQIGSVVRPLHSVGRCAIMSCARCAGVRGAQKAGRTAPLSSAVARQTQRIPQGTAISASLSRGSEETAMNRVRSAARISLVSIRLRRHGRRAAVPERQLRDRHSERRPMQYRAVARKHVDHRLDGKRRQHRIPDEQCWTAKRGHAQPRPHRPGTHGGMAQTFDPVLGETYQVYFDLAGNPSTGFPPAVKPAQVTVAGVTAQLHLDTTGKSTSSMGWLTNSFHVVRHRRCRDDRLPDHSRGTSFSGAALDNVRMRCTDPWNGNARNVQDNSGPIPCAILDRHRRYRTALRPTSSTRRIFRLRDQPAVIPETGRGSRPLGVRVTSANYVYSGYHGTMRRGCHA